MAVRAPFAGEKPGDHMMNITDFARRTGRQKRAAALLFVAGAVMLVVDFTTKFPTVEKGEFAAVWLVAMAIGGFLYYRSMELPAKEVLALAESHNGLVTVGELSTALEIDPAVVLRTLGYLQKMGLASQRWGELQRNLWEFPDYVKLPIAETIDLARENKGRVTLGQLVARGLSLDVAQQTLDTLADKGLGQPDAAAPERTLILKTQ